MINHRLKISPEARARIIAYADALDALPTVKELARETGLTPRQVDAMMCNHRRKVRARLPLL